MNGTPTAGRSSPKPESTERTLAIAGQVVVGEFRCAPDARDFATAGSITRHCFVFPRRGVWIEHELHPAFVADPTRITLYNPRQAYERRALDPAGDRSDWITVSDPIAREVVSRFDPHAAESDAKVFRHPCAPARAELYLAQRHLHEYVRRTPAPDLLFVEETAVTLLAHTIGGLYDPAQRPRRAAVALTRRHRAIVEDVRAYLNATVRQNESLTTVAAAVGSSVFHLCRVFRRGTGSTMHAYRHDLRLRHALESLEQHDADLLTVALDLGYSGHSHFTDAFRRQFGVVPSRLRAQFGTTSGATSVLRQP